MSDQAPLGASHSTIARMSRSAVGRVSGAMSRWIGGASTIQATGKFLRRQLWAWPIVATVVFGGSGWLVHRSVENAMRDQRKTDLNAMVEASATAIRGWIADQQNDVTLFAEDEQLRLLVLELLPLADGSSMAEC